jgi:hypothetical protein
MKWNRILKKILTQKYTWVSKWWIKQKLITLSLVLWFSWERPGGRLFCGFVHGGTYFLGRGLGTACFVCGMGQLFSGERPGGRCFLGGMGAIVFWGEAWGPLFSGWHGGHCFLGGAGFIVFWVVLSSILGWAGFGKVYRGCR